MKTSYSYCLFYIENKYYKKINDELNHLGYKHIKAIIPTLQILKKTRKSKMYFEEVPILFEYGFMRMPTCKAYSRTFLNKLRRQIPGIRSWVKSPETIFDKKVKKRIDNAEDWDDFSKVATVPRSEVFRFKRLAKKNKKYSVDDLMNLKIGDYVILRQYPFKGVDATIDEIDYNNQMVQVVMYPQYGKMTIQLPFDTIFYSIYEDYDPDKLIANDMEFNPNIFTQDYLDRMNELKRRPKINK